MLGKMVGWHHWLNGHEFEQTQGDREGQGSLACCCSWGCKELDTIKWLNNNNRIPRVAQWRRIHLQSRRSDFDPWVKKMPWRKKWQPTPAFLPGKSHGQISLEDYSPRDHNKSRTWLSNYITTTEHHRLCGLQATIIYFSQFWRLRSSKSKDQKIQCLVRTLPDSYIVILSHRAEEENKDTNPIVYSWPQPLLKVPPPNITIFGIWI